MDSLLQEDYDRLRPLSYPQTDVFLICFSVTSPPSFANISTKWLPEITYHAPGVPFLIVGTKIDLRNDETMLQKLAEKGYKLITFSDIVQLGKQLGAYRAVECSALEGHGVVDVFNTALDAALGLDAIPRRDAKKKCIVS
jgi:cell division control protein 42